MFLSPAVPPSWVCNVGPRGCIKGPSGWSKESLNISRGFSQISLSNPFVSLDVDVVFWNFNTISQCALSNAFLFFLRPNSIPSPPPLPVFPRAPIFRSRTVLHRHRIWCCCGTPPSHTGGEKLDKLGWEIIPYFCLKLPKFPPPNFSQFFDKFHHFSTTRMKWRQFGGDPYIET